MIVRINFHMLVNPGSSIISVLWLPTTYLLAHVFMLCKLDHKQAPGAPHRHRHTGTPDTQQQDDFQR
jgi:hypothetical protein